MTRLALLAYCLGIALLVFLPSLDVWPQLLMGWLVVLALSLLLYRDRALIPTLVFAFGMGGAWHMHWAAERINDRLAKDLEGEDISVRGQVITTPQRFDLIQQFVFRVSASEQAVAGALRLNYYGDDNISFGDNLELMVRLNRPHSLANPGSFDREAYMLRRGIVGSGYIREILSSSRSFQFSLTGIRAEVARRLEKITRDSPYQGLILALVLGEKGQVTEAHSDLFVQTGTSHLFVISGLHIGLVAGVFYWLTSLLTTLLPPLLLYFPRQKIASIAALTAAIGYSAMAGFTLPTQRAVVMLAVFILSGLWEREVATSYRLLLALGLILTLDPLATTSAGFWYSFVAVAGLLFSTNFLAPNLNPANNETRFINYVRAGQGLLARVLKPQLTIFVVLLLPLLFWGQAPSLLSPLTNTFAIPFVGVVIVPLSLLLSLLTLVANQFAPFLLGLIEWSFDALLGALQWLALLQNYWLGQLSSEPRQVTGFAGLSAGLGVALLLAPLKASAKLLSLSLMLPLFWPAQRSNNFDLAVHVLDVGQGLAVVVQTPEHNLLYDTGFGLDDGYSVGRAVVVPALASLGIRQLDTVVISHGDNDHIGGLNDVLAAFPEAALFANSAVVAQALRPALDCSDTEPWQWDTVWFQLLSVGDAGLSDNNQSCVLKVSTPAASVLLPGDIERTAELLLVTTFADSLASELLIAPHHGSKSSSSYPFLKTVKPQTIIVSAGYNNRFGHPSQAITQRYAILGIDYFISHAEGMLSVVYPPLGSEPIAPLSYRKSNPRYWR
jgi:competence protein ComEC